MQFIIGLLLAILIATLALKTHSLNKSGAIAAAILGTLIFGIGGWQWAIVLLTFFITSSALSRAFKKRKEGLDEKFSKGSDRDWGQVFGNGTLAAAFATLHFFFPNESWPWFGFAAALAAVNADTWATELGVLSRNLPRSITNLSKTVEKGTSGGISLFGTFASLLGSAVIALLAVWLTPAFNPLNTNYFFLITAVGIAGALFDSLLGATVQAMYYCPADKKETEKHPLHTCGTKTVHIRGWKRLNNDLVNFACSAFGAITYLLVAGFFFS